MKLEIPVLNTKVKAWIRYNIFVAKVTDSTYGTRLENIRDGVYVSVTQPMENYPGDFG